MNRKTASEITDPELDALYGDLAAYERAPILRGCIMPGCMRQYDARAALCGEPPARESWSAVGWLQVRGFPTHPGGGQICPDHAELITAHRPLRVEPFAGRIGARCMCAGWALTSVRWHGALRGSWEEHLIEVAEAAGVLQRPDWPPDAPEPQLAPAKPSDARTARQETP